jgi:GNAT superfamily N-acetyltransferase
MGRGKRYLATASRATPALASPTWTAARVDIPALLTLKAAIVLETYGELGTEEQRLEWLERFCSPSYFSERIGPDAIFYSIGPREQPRAMAALKRRDGKAYFGDLYCADKGQGLGRRLFEERLTQARAWGLETGVCDVFAMNAPALAFVAKMGFQPVSEYEEQSFRVPVIRHERAL